MFWFAIAAYLLVINPVTFAAYAIDKSQAQQQGCRISEQALLTLGLIGGTPAAFAAQRILRHKTRKRSFQLAFWFTVFLQLSVLAVLWHQLSPSSAS